jgi:hypothetical protein
VTKCYDIDHELDAALSDFIEVWSDDMLHAHIGEKLTCREAEALAGVLDALCKGAGESLLDAHSWGDEPEDLHYDRDREPVEGESV